MNYQKGCCNYDSIKTVNGFIHQTYKEACCAKGLLADDKEFIDAIIECSDLALGNQLRRLFVTLLMMNTMPRPDEVWNKTWKLLSNDILYQKRKEFVLPGIIFFYLKFIIVVWHIISFLGLRIEHAQIQNLCLLQVEELLILNGKCLKDFPSLPEPIHSYSFIYQNRFIIN